MNTNDTGVITPTPFMRADALRTAAEVLTVKAGRFAERPLDAFAVVALADYILEGDVNVTLENLLVETLEDLDVVTAPADNVVNVTFGGGLDDVLAEARARAAHPSAHDDGNGINL